LKLLKYFDSHAQFGAPKLSIDLRYVKQSQRFSMKSKRMLFVVS